MNETLFAQIEELDRARRENDEQRAKLRSEAIGEVQRIIDAFELKPSDFGFVSSSKRAAKPAAAPQFRDPQTGKTWSGRGRVPAWIKEAEAVGKSREDFRIRN